MNHSFFNSLDYFYIILTFISCVIGFLRGFVKDFFSTCAWVGSGFLAAYVAPYWAHSLQISGIPNPTFAKITAIIISYLIILITFLLAINLVSISIKNTILSGIDRAVGSLFGFARGVLILVTLCLICAMFDVFEKAYPFIENSKLTPYLLLISEDLLPKIEKFVPKEEETPKVSRKQVSKEKPKGEQPSISEENDIQKPENNTKKISYVRQMEEYVSSIFSQNFDDDRDRIKRYRNSNVRLPVKNKDENVEFGCMNLIKARVQRRARKKAEKIKQEIRKRLDKRPL